MVTGTSFTNKIIINMVLYVLILFSFVALSCKDKDKSTLTVIASERAKLINNIESYQSIEEFERFLQSTSIKWKGEGDKKTKTKKRPMIVGRDPFNLYAIIIKDYSHLDFIGKLKVSFFNNRLISTRFYPNNMKDYIQTLENQYNIKLLVNDTVEFAPYARIILFSDHENNMYLEFYDVRLEDEFNSWIKNNT